MALSLKKQLTEPRRVELGEGVAVTLAPIGLARFSRLNGAALVEAQAQLAAEGRADPTALEISTRAQALLNDQLIVESITAWEGLEDEGGELPEITLETWRLFAAIYPELASLAIAEIRRPGILADAEGNASAPSPSGGQAGAPSIAATAPASPATRGSPAPATGGKAEPARSSRTRPDRKRGGTSPKS